MSPRYACTVTPNPELYKSPDLGMDKTAIAHDFKSYYGNHLAQDKGCASGHYLYSALALTLRDRLFERMKQTKHTYAKSKCRQAYYLSMEFLMGRAMGNAALNLGLDQTVTQAMHDLGLDFEELTELEHDAGLGNGGLGRLAACFLDSCASLSLPVIGYGFAWVGHFFFEHNRPATFTYPFYSFAGDWVMLFQFLTGTLPTEHFTESRETAK